MSFFCGYLYISRTQNLRNMKPGLDTWMPSLIKKVGAINISTQLQLQNQYARLIFKTIRKYSKLFESFILRMLRNILLQAG